jgi:uncharacterized protein (TIGR02452 family)
MEMPWLNSFITAPALMAKTVLERDRSRRGEISAALRERIHKVLAVARQVGHKELVLGAWGCGAFGNDAVEVAGLFAEAFDQGFRGVFERVVFAITDWSEERRFIGPFEAAFGGR